MSGEQKIQISGICTDVSYGYTESATDDVVGPKFLRITDIQGGIVNWENVPYCPIDEGKIGKYLLENGDIVVARTGNSTGENYAYKGNGQSVFASYLIRFRVDKSKANPFFVWYQMRSRRWWDFVAGAKGGSAQADANAKVLGSFEVFLLSLENQNEIVRHLENLDDKIEFNRQINQTLEQMAQAIFKSWFVDFEPVRAKIRAKEEWKSKNGELKAGLLERLHLRIFVHEVQHPQGRVPVFKVPPRPIGMPVQYKGAYWMRGGEDLVPMTPDMLKRIFEDAELIVDHGITVAALVLLGTRKALADKKGVYTRKKGLDRDTNKALLLKHIKDNKATGSRFQEFLQVLPSLTVDEVKTLLKELKKDRQIHVVGCTRGARWFPDTN